MNSYAETAEQYRKATPTSAQLYTQPPGLNPSPTRTTGGASHTHHTANQHCSPPSESPLLLFLLSLIWLCNCYFHAGSAHLLGQVGGPCDRSAAVSDGGAGDRGDPATGGVQELRPTGAPLAASRDAAMTVAVWCCRGVVTRALIAPGTVGCTALSAPAAVRALHACKTSCMPRLFMAQHSPCVAGDVEGGRDPCTVTADAVSRAAGMLVWSLQPHPTHSACWTCSPSHGGFWGKSR